MHKQIYLIYISGYLVSFYRSSIPCLKFPTGLLDLYTITGFCYYKQCNKHLYVYFYTQLQILLKYIIFTYISLKY